MKHRIDPRIDCVFKALLGAERNRNLLIHFLNAVLAGELAAPITDAVILNPYNDKEFLDDKLSIVDVKARDGEGRLFQIEIQMLSYRHLPARILYGWADIYTKQLKSGKDYDQLRPAYSIWLLADNLLRDDDRYAHHFKLRDERGRILIEYGGIWVLELDKFAAERVKTEEQRWLKLFKDGETLDDGNLPDWMNTDEMRQAMTTLQQFSEKERDYHAYQARQNFLREQRTIQKEREEAEREREIAEQARARAELALEEERAEHAKAQAAALAEIERLKALLERR
ncbi:Rpn family recombination-promoting nuclease/putative transposase [Methylomagnum sp.]